MESKNQHHDIAKLFPFESKKLGKEIVFDIDTFKSVRKSIAYRESIIGIYTIRRNIANSNNNEHLYQQFANLVSALEKVNDEKISFIALNLKTEGRFFCFLVFTNVQLDKVLCIVELGFNEGEL